MSNLSPIPFYKSLEEQSARLWYNSGELYKNKVPNDTLIPFYGICPFQDAFLNNAKIVFCDGYEQEITIELEERGFEIVGEGTTMFIYPAYEAEGGITTKTGQAHLELTFGSQSGNQTLYSEEFHIVPRAELNNCVKIMWRCMENLDSIPFGTESDYMNILYFDTTIGMPDYQTTEEGEERSGLFFPIRQISEKVYKMTILAPEYIADIMRTIRLADQITVIDQRGKIYDLNQFAMDVNWEEQGYYASISCSMHTDTLIRKIGKAY